MPNACRRILVVTFLYALAAASFAADTFPSRPVRMIVPFAPGGASDFVGRVLQPKLTEVLGQQVVVDRKMYDTTIKVLHDPWVVERLGAGGADIIQSKSPEDCAQFMKVQNEFFGDLVRRVGAVQQ